MCLNPRAKSDRAQNSPQGRLVRTVSILCTKVLTTKAFWNNLASLFTNFLVWSGRQLVHDFDSKIPKDN